MKIETVDGENKGNVMLYALSTCSWCKKTKNLLSDKVIVGFKEEKIDEALNNE